jgi:hypothetical protein
MPERGGPESESVRRNGITFRRETPTLLRVRAKEINSMPNPKETARDRFMATVREIQATLAAISEAADDHFDVEPEAVTWANVGDAKRTLTGLNEVLAIIRGENK